MDVRVDSNAGFLEAQSHHDVRRLTAHAGKTQKCIKIRRDVSAESLNQLPADFMNGPSLRPIEGDRVDRTLDPLYRDVQRGLRRDGQSEQSVARCECRLVLGAQAKDARHQNSER